MNAQVQLNPVYGGDVSNHTHQVDLPPPAYGRLHLRGDNEQVYGQQSTSLRLDCPFTNSRTNLSLNYESFPEEPSGHKHTATVRFGSAGPIGYKRHRASRLPPASPARDVDQRRVHRRQDPSTAMPHLPFAHKPQLRYCSAGHEHLDACSSGTHIVSRCEEMLCICAAPVMDDDVHDTCTAPILKPPTFTPASFSRWAR